MIEGGIVESRPSEKTKGRAFVRVFDRPPFTLVSGQRRISGVEAISKIVVLW